MSFVTPTRVWKEEARGSRSRSRSPGIGLSSAVASSAILSSSVGISGFFIVIKNLGTSGQSYRNWLFCQGSRSLALFQNAHIRLLADCYARPGRPVQCFEKEQSSLKVCETKRNIKVSSRYVSP